MAPGKPTQTGFIESLNGQARGPQEHLSPAHRLQHQATTLEPWRGSHQPSLHLAPTKSIAGTDSPSDRGHPQEQVTLPASPPPVQPSAMPLTWALAIASRLGQFLHTTSIDELPQLLNVVRRSAARCSRPFARPRSLSGTGDGLDAVRPHPSLGHRPTASCRQPVACPTLSLRQPMGWPKRQDSNSRTGTASGQSTGASTRFAAQGSLYLRSDGGFTTRAYTNTDGGTTSTALVSVE
jgi:hypothetical protein